MYRNKSSDGTLYGRSRSLENDKGYQRFKEDYEIRLMKCETTREVAERVLELVEEKHQKWETGYVEHDYSSQDVEMWYNDGKTNKEFKWDNGAPKSVCGRNWIMDYLNEMGMNYKKMKKRITRDRFRFGETVYDSLGEVDIPVFLKDKKGELEKKEVTVHVIENNIEMLVGNNTRDGWKVTNADYKNTFYLNDDLSRPFQCRRTKSGHVAIELWLGKLPGEVYFGEIEKKKGKNSAAAPQQEPKKKFFGLF